MSRIGRKPSGGTTSTKPKQRGRFLLVKLVVLLSAVQCAVFFFLTKTKSKGDDEGEGLWLSMWDSSAVERNFNIDTRKTTAEGRLLVGQSQVSASAVAGNETGRLVHTCTCLERDNSGSGYGKQDEDEGNGLRWLHIPKTGTSFISSIWSSACNTRGNIDLSLSPFLQSRIRNAGTACQECYDIALIVRYPYEWYCRRDSLSSMETAHAPWSPPTKTNPSRKEMAVGFFRHPASRAVSAFDHNMHVEAVHTPAGMKSRTAIVQACGGKQRNLTCYANHPAVQGCMTRMLTGKRCVLLAKTNGKNNAEGNSSAPSSAVLAAVDALGQMGFVGITEEWNESICQFHKSLAQGGHPRQNEFTNVRKGAHAHSVKDLGEGYVDREDDLVYEAARKEFYRRRGPEPCYKPVYVQDTDLDADGRGSNKDFGHVVPFGKSSPISACVPKSCADLGKHCGQWPDGCGGVTACGFCSPSRNGLPDTWRMQCLEGKCIPTCPTWSDAGLWFKNGAITNDDTAEGGKQLFAGAKKRGHKQWMRALKDAGAPMPVKKKGATTVLHAAEAKELDGVMLQLEILDKKVDYLPPGDAVAMCVMACAAATLLQKDDKESFASRYCICGDPPKSFYDRRKQRRGVLTWSPPRSADYEAIQQLNPGVKATRIKFTRSLRATLGPKETQPKCCPPGRVISTNSQWRFGTVYADYFNAIHLGCGGQNECEAYGRERNASVVVFHLVPRICFLGRNQGDAIPGTDAQFHNNFPRIYLRLDSGGSDHAYKEAAEIGNMPV